MVVGALQFVVSEAPLLNVVNEAKISGLSALRALVAMDTNMSVGIARIRRTFDGLMAFVVCAKPYTEAVDDQVARLHDPACSQEWCRKSDASKFIRITKTKILVA